MVRITFDYVGSEHGVLSLRAGDIATFLEPKDRGWCMLRANTGQEGYFPQVQSEHRFIVLASSRQTVACKAR